MHAVALDLGERTLRLDWDDGESDAFHYIWLRDNAPLPAELHPETGERSNEFHDLELAIRPLSAELDASGALLVRWPDVATPVRYQPEWLRAHAYGAARLAAARRPVKLWGGEMLEQRPTYDYGEVIGADATQLRFLRDLRHVGFAILQDAPREAGEIERLASTLGYLHEVCFGRVRDVKVSPDAYNVAFTTSVVRPHTDLANYAWPPGFQVLHCLLQGAKGGDTRLVDGFFAADRLRREDPLAFEALTRVEVQYRIANPRYDVQVAAPVLQLDAAGDLKMIRFSNQTRRVLRCPPELVEPFYAGYHRLSALLNDPASQIHFRLRPGDMLAMNNHRVLHARDAFDQGSGHRHLQIGSMDLDIVDSRIRMIERRMNSPQSTAEAGFAAS